LQFFACAVGIITIQYQREKEIPINLKISERKAKMYTYIDSVCKQQVLYNLWLFEGLSGGHTYEVEQIDKNAGGAVDIILFPSFEEANDFVQSLTD
jgi:hypothetical protein